MGYPVSSHAYADQTQPEAWAWCDRCGNRYMHKDLAWQCEWRGNHLQSLNFLVCPTCLDIPQEQARAILIGPDSLPIKDPRPGAVASQIAAGANEQPADFTEYAWSEADWDGGTWNFGGYIEDN